MKTCYRPLPRWKKLLVIIRAIIPYTNLNPIKIEFDCKKIGFRYYQDGSLSVIEEEETGEVMITFSEDGTPEYLTDWAKEPAMVEPYDIALYEEVFVNDDKE